MASEDDTEQQATSAERDIEFDQPESRNGVDLDDSTATGEGTPGSMVNEGADGTLMNISNGAPLQNNHDLCNICGMLAVPHEARLCLECKAVLHWQCGYPVRGGADDLRCSLCNNNAEMARHRMEARAGQVAAAEAMKKRSNEILDEFKVGDSVLVPVPEVDRGPIDFANIMGVVLKEQNGVYQIGTRAGVLQVIFLT